MAKRWEAVCGQREYFNVAAGKHIGDTSLEIMRQGAYWARPGLADRGATREISKAFERAEFPHFDRQRVPRVAYAGVMRYDGDEGVPDAIRTLIQAGIKASGRTWWSSGVSGRAGLQGGGVRAHAIKPSTPLPTRPP